MGLALSLKQQIGQLLITGFEGTTLSPWVERLIRDRHVGGIILFERNFESPAQLEELIQKMQRIALSSPPAVPLFISVDQEGGRVSRLKSPFTSYPPPASLGKARSESLAHRCGLALGRELNSVGINMDFAPVLDVNTNPENPIIGERALSDQAEWVARLGNHVLRGLQEAGVIPVGKHFPGHGDTSQDSHLELPYVERDTDTLTNVELVPFETAVQAGLEVIMTAHVIYTAWDNQYPATFSKTILRDILRKRLGFDGLIISDDLEMKAIETHLPFDSLPSLGMEAGINLFLICNNPDKMEAFQDQMLSDVDNGRISPEHIEETCDKILELKNKISPFPSDQNLKTLIGDHREIVREMESFLT